MKTTDEAMQLLDEKYEPIIRRAIAARGLTTVRQIAKFLDKDPATTWRMMRRMGFRPSEGWRKP